MRNYKQTKTFKRTEAHNILRLFPVGACSRWEKMPRKQLKGNGSMGIDRAQYPLYRLSGLAGRSLQVTRQACLTACIRREVGDFQSTSPLGRRPAGCSLSPRGVASRRLRFETFLVAGFLSFLLACACTANPGCLLLCNTEGLVSNNVFMLVSGVSWKFIAFFNRHAMSQFLGQSRGNSSRLILAWSLGLTSSACASTSASLYLFKG